MYILLQNTISNIITKQYVQFQNQCGNITFFKIKNMQLCRWHLTQIWDFEKCDCLFSNHIILMRHAQISKHLFWESVELCCFGNVTTCQNTHFPTFPEQICWNLCMAQPINLFENKNALTFSRISYFSMCHLHSYVFLLWEMWCSQLAFWKWTCFFWERAF